MGLSTWLKQSRLKRMESKLKGLRSRQKLVRRKEEDLANQRRAGSVTAEDAKVKEQKLHDEKERLTHEINGLLHDEERLRDELKRADALPAR
jgi:chromosome segregation ATPase